MGAVVTLRAHQGRPLDDPRVRDTVRAAAEAIAERTGVELIALETAPDSITIEIRGSRLEAIGLAAELRRVTNAWRHGRGHSEPLWGEAPAGDDDLDFDNSP
ncbi:MAG: hypothetical protein ACF8QF_09190 [Phycisphaerales bacterium]